MAAITSLDQIVRNVLLKNRYSLHWYVDFMLYAAECLKELTIDDLHVINTKLCTLSSTNTIEIPADYSDYVSVCVKVGQHLRPLVEDNSLNPMPNYDDNFVNQPYVSYTGSNDGYFNQYLYPTVFQAASRFDDYGEALGKRYGWAGGNGNDTFKVIKERNVIQINQYISNDCKIVFGYIGDGRNADAATHIDIDADATIKSYSNWQRKENSRSYSLAEKERDRMLYVNERLILRARKSDLTLTKMKRILSKNSIASK